MYFNPVGERKLGCPLFYVHINNICVSNHVVSIYSNNFH